MGGESGRAEVKEASAKCRGTGLVERAPGIMPFSVLSPDGVPTTAWGEGVAPITFQRGERVEDGKTPQGGPAGQGHSQGRRAALHLQITTRPADAGRVKDGAAGGQ